MSRLVLIFLLVSFGANLTAQGAEIDAVTSEQPTAGDKGRAIALEANRRDQGFSDSTTELTMLLTNAEGASEYAG